MNKDDERLYYRVESQYSDGSADNTEEVYDLKNVDGEWKLTKREFGQMMLFLTSVMLIGGCAVNKAVINKKKIHTESIDKPKTEIDYTPAPKAADKPKDEINYTPAPKTVDKPKVEVKPKNVSNEKMRLESKESGTYKESTLPCGSPIPLGAICKCNCIPVSSPRSYGTGSYGTYCSCNRVCTCNKVCTCIPVFQSRCKFSATLFVFIPLAECYIVRDLMVLFL